MLKRNKSELEPPPIASEESACEILRVWGGPDLPQQFTLKTTWDDPAAWGLLLVDIARHSAKAYATSGSMSEAQALERIKMLFDAEWHSSTDEPQQLA